jgi:hypothetical protein
MVSKVNSRDISRRADGLQANGSNKALASFMVARLSRSDQAMMCLAWKCTI